MTEENKLYLIAISVIVIIVMDNLSIKNHLPIMCGLMKDEPVKSESSPPIESEVESIPEYESEPEQEAEQEVEQEVEPEIASETVQETLPTPENEPEGFSDSLKNNEVKGSLISLDDKYNGCGVPNDEIKDLIRLSKFNDIYHQRDHIPDLRDHPHIGKARTQFHPQKIYNFH
ncbi:MAG: hypothetical protein CMF62_01745 [Magnetococcales bacterium]|nr:hypothetical protein [Magnetococcales bacterium]